MISCSHWGMFPRQQNMPALPKGYQITPGFDWQAELMRPDGMIPIIRTPKERPFSIARVILGYFG